MSMCLRMCVGTHEWRDNEGGDWARCEIVKDDFHTSQIIQHLSVVFIDTGTVCAFIQKHCLTFIGHIFGRRLCTLLRTWRPDFTSYPLFLGLFFTTAMRLLLRCEDQGSSLCCCLTPYCRFALARNSPRQIWVCCFVMLYTWTYNVMFKLLFIYRLVC